MPQHRGQHGDKQVSIIIIVIKNIGLGKVRSLKPAVHNETWMSRTSVHMTSMTLKERMREDERDVLELSYTISQDHSMRALWLGLCDWSFKVALWWELSSV